MPKRSVEFFYLGSSPIGVSGFPLSKWQMFCLNVYYRCAFAFLFLSDRVSRLFGRKDR
jgi:hypothetical protein